MCPEKHVLVKKNYLQMGLGLVCHYELETKKKKWQTGQ